MFVGLWESSKKNIIEYLSVDRLAEYLEKIITVIVIILATKLIMRFIRFFVDKIFSDYQIGKLKYHPRRAQTLKSLIKSIIHYTLYFLAGMMILEEFNFPISSILAGAGILGLAIGFGAQNLVRDVISGFFILFENQFSVGDHVKIDDIEGIVEEIGLRTTIIKSFAGQICIIPNGKINIVTNFHAAKSMRIMFDIGVSYEEDVDRVMAVLEEICEEFALENDQLIEIPKVLGVQELGEYAVSIRILARSKPLEQWGVERALKHKIKKRFDIEEIEIPYPKKVLFIGQPLQNKDHEVAPER